MTMSIILDARTANDHFPGIGRYVVNLAQALTRVTPDLDLRLLIDPSAQATRLALPDLPHIDCPISPFALQQQWIDCLTDEPVATSTFWAKAKSTA